MSGAITMGVHNGSHADAPFHSKGAHDIDTEAARDLSRRRSRGDLTAKLKLIGRAKSRLAISKHRRKRRASSSDRSLARFKNFPNGSR